ncbi:MAG: hypothetical protein ACI808_000187 [Paraglaciecola sp.]|jgi:hypothetical protein
MNKKTIGSIFVVAISVLVSTTSVQAIPVLVNGGFETGDFTGWTQVSSASLGGTCAKDWYVSGTDVECNQGLNTQLNSAAEGNFSTYNSFDGFAETNYTIEQDIALGSVSSATLDFDFTLGWDFGLGGLATLDRVFSVSFLDAADSFIGDAFVFNVGPSNGSTGFIDWTSQSIDVSSLLSSFGNQTVTLVANIFIPEDRTGPASFGLDAVNLDVESISSVAVPSPSVFSIFALGLLMMIGVGRRAK